MIKAYIVWPLAVLFGPVVYLFLWALESIGLTMGQIIVCGTILAFCAAIVLGVAFERARKL